MNKNRRKRAISNADAFNASPMKRLRVKTAELHYQTPCPTSISSSEGFRLPSSVGSPEAYGNLSPVPRRSSTNAKENIIGSPRRGRTKRTYGTRGKLKPRGNLGSPFSTRSSSADSISRKSSFTNKNHARPTRKLSDLHYNPNISHSAANSPSKSEPEPLAIHTLFRRPSAPALSGPAPWPLQLSPKRGETGESRVEHKANFSTNMTIDFNRPPSQLSMYDYNCYSNFDADIPSVVDDVFFADIRGVSTPFRTEMNTLTGSRTVDPSLLCASAHTDTDSDDDVGKNSNCCRQQLPSRSLFKDYLTTTSCDSDDSLGLDSDYTPWISDSLISPPKTAEWKLHRERRGQQETAHEEDVEMDDETMQPIEERVLEELFDSMILEKPEDTDTEKHGDGVTQPGRSVSLDSAVENSISVHRKRLRRSTIKISDLYLQSATSQSNEENPTALEASFPVVSLGARRTRSGTVVPAAAASPLARAIAIPTTKRTRSGTLVSVNQETASSKVAELKDSVITDAHNNEPPKRSRSGTVMAHSVAPTDRNEPGRQAARVQYRKVQSSGTTAAVSTPTDDDRDPLDFLSSPNDSIRPPRSIVKRVARNLLQKPALGRWRAMSQITNADKDDESDDELLLV